MMYVRVDGGIRMDIMEGSVWIYFDNQKSKALRSLISLPVLEKLLDLPSRSSHFSAMVFYGADCWVCS